MADSPNVLNYHIGKGIVKFTPDGGVERDVGNCATADTTPSIEFLDHYSSRSGIKAKDRSVAVQAGGTLNLVMDEITLENLQMQLFGGPITESTAGTSEFDILEVSEVVGQIEIVGTNDVGPKYTLILPKVSFKPSGAFKAISEEWNQIELQGEILRADSGTYSGSFGKVIQTADVVAA